MGRVPVYSAKVNGDYSYNMYGPFDEVSCKKPSKSSDSDHSCYFIVTCLSLAWTLLTLATTVIVVAAIITPQWLVGKPQWTGVVLNNSTDDEMRTTVDDSAAVSYHPTIGIFNRCTRFPDGFGVVTNDVCDVYVTGFGMPSDEFPHPWKPSLILLTVGVVFLLFTDVTAILGLCVQSMCKKSLFTMSGLVQSLAALCLVVGQVLYPAGWGSQRVKDLCGEDSGAFLIADCKIGWAFYGCMGGTVLVFLCALLSIKAENTTSSDKVERKITKGKTCICTV